MADKANFQEISTDPYTLQTNGRRANLWDALGRAIHSTVPERANPAYKPGSAGGPPQGDPYQHAGFFRSLLGDRSNQMNLDSQARGRDLSTSRGLAEKQDEVDTSGEKTQHGYRMQLLDKTGANQLKNTAAEGMNSFRNSLLPHMFNEPEQRLKYSLEGGLQTQGNDAAMRRLSTQQEFERGMGNTKFEQEKALRGVPQALDPALAAMYGARSTSVLENTPEGKTQATLDLLNKLGGTSGGPATPPPKTGVVPRKHPDTQSQIAPTDSTQPANSQIPVSPAAQPRPLAVPPPPFGGSYPIDPRLLRYGAGAGAMQPGMRPLNTGY